MNIVDLEVNCIFNDNFKEIDHKDFILRLFRLYMKTFLEDEISRTDI